MQMAALALASLTGPRRRLVELMRDIHFGRIEYLLVRDGEPVWDPPPRIVREVKFPREIPCGATLGAEFLLKQQVVELLNFFDQMQDGTIAVLEIKHGLPFRILVEDRAV
jgi:hypothetical protein